MVPNLDELARNVPQSVTRRAVLKNLCIGLTGLALVCLPAMAQVGAGSALSFNSTGYVSIATTGSLTGTFTVELWANPADNSPGGLLALFGSRTPNEYGFDMKFWLGHLIHGDIGNGTSWLTSAADAEYRYVPGQWIHIAYVVTPTGYEIYLNGQLMANGNYPLNNPVLYDATHQLWIGHIGFSSEYMNGLIDEVRIWNTARTQSEIQNNLQRRLSGTEPGLMGYWRFDEGGGPIVADASGHGFLGLLFGPPVWTNSTAPIEALFAVTTPADGVSSNSATLKGTVFPNYQNAVAWFEYGTSTNYGNTTAVISIVASNGSPVDVSSQINGLSVGTLYHCRLVATNIASTSFGNDITFVVNQPSSLVNGGFETGDFTGWSHFGNTTYDDVDTDLSYVHSGVYGASLGPVGSLGYLSQNVATIPGMAYLISFWLDSPDGRSPNQFNVTWDGASIFNAINIPAIGWTNVQLKVVATTASSLLTFSYRNDPAFFGLDDVSMEAISPPSFLPGIPTIDNGQVILKWSSFVGQLYQLQYATSLDLAFWQDLGGPITAIDTVTTAFDAIGSEPQRFYRVTMQ